MQANQREHRANLKETARFVWNIFVFSWGVCCSKKSEKCPGIPTHEALLLCCEKKIWKYPTTKETWPKNDAYRKCPAVTGVMAAQFWSSPKHERDDSSHTSYARCDSVGRSSLGFWAGQILSPIMSDNVPFKMIPPQKKRTCRAFMSLQNPGPWKADRCINSSQNFAQIFYLTNPTRSGFSVIFPSVFPYAGK